MRLSLSPLALSRRTVPSLGPLLALRGGMESSLTDQMIPAYEWTVNIATAGALVAGASLASLFDHGLHIDLVGADGTPRRMLHHLRMLSSVILALSFAFEICVVFAATVTGTLLLSGGKHGNSRHSFDPIASSPMDLMQRELEFQYILIRAGFFQGLLNWLVAIGLRFFVSLMTPPDDVAVDRIDSIVGAQDTELLARKRACLGLGLMLTLFSLVTMMLAFYNYHLSYYNNYAAMLQRLGILTWQRYVACEPIRVLPRMAFVMSIFAGGALLLSFVLPMVPSEPLSDVRH